MTEIPVFPPGMPEGEPPAPGDWHGLWAGMHRHLGRIASNLPDPRRERLERAGAIIPITVDPTPIPLAAGFGVLDIPNMFSPSLGTIWDVTTVSCTGFTAGKVNGWRNLPAASAGAGGDALQGALRAPFPQAGVLTFGQGQLILRAGDRLVFVATGITVPAGGQVLVSLDANQVADEYVGSYLL